MINFNGFRDCQGVFRLGSEIMSRAILSGVSQQALDGPQIACLSCALVTMVRRIGWVPFGTSQSRPQ